MIFTLPISGFVSIVGFAVFRLSGDGVQLAPCLPLGLVDLSLLFLRELFVGNEFFHNATSSSFVSFRASAHTGVGIPKIEGDCHTSLRTGSQ